MILEWYNNLGEVKLETQLLKHIRNHKAYPIVVGAAYRLTSKPLLRALEGKKCVSILAQDPGWKQFKQDYSNVWFSYQQLIKTVPGAGNNLGLSFGEAIDTLTPAYQPCKTEAIRSIGERERRHGNKEHYKFLVFCDVVVSPLKDPFKDTALEGEIDPASLLGKSATLNVCPKAVWTGSANFTQLGLNQNGETAIFTDNPDMVRQHYDLWISLFLRSQSIAELGNQVLSQFTHLNLKRQVAC